ncbi:aldehyde dehydrogenase family protein [Phenylobacterium sp.]|uniref:aldehyde dehydrogenase family protein n=1 Tax=Phenylobacterium sp. TaxID=1871053 RepID=UPI002CFEE71F|nr:aldehyde dehydrogenase family protein [Phenylobacterium sp.]HLZ77217.1 aldehyde dehydrogenase family protein [Phenylobacterium sp.]
MINLTTHYIDGRFAESHGREVMDSINPTTGEVLAKVTLGDEEDARAAIAAAKRAFASYGKTSKTERIALLNRLHEAVLARTDKLTSIWTQEYGGVTRFAALIVESGAVFYAAAAKALEDDVPLEKSWGQTNVTWGPIGVTGLITAWNANSLFICLKTASALAAGCTVVLKPSEMSALQTRVMIEAFDAAGVPPGVINVVNGLGATVGAEMVRNPDVAKISFTGSGPVGQSIMRDGAATMKRVTLELGGKSPNILMDDANLAVAIPTSLWIAFLNSGQACAAGTRLLVPRKNLEAVKAAIRQAMGEFVVGDPADPSTAVGPMVSQKQWDRVQSYIRKGIEEGAEVLAGGPGRPDGFPDGFFVKPTVFLGTNDMAIAREEIFGPVLTVIPYDDDADAIRLANDSDYGLHAYVNGTDRARARRLAEQIEAGRVVINGMADDPQAPWGGFKHSGVGREYGAFGIEAFLEPRAILEVAG